MKLNEPAPNAPEYKLEVSREFAAPQEMVWKAWTSADQLKNWLSLGDGMKVESARMDLRVGGKFRIQLRQPDGEYFTAAGTYLDVQPIDKLAYTWDWEKDGAGTEFGELEGQETQITVEFTTVGNRTKLTLTHEKFNSPERRDRHVTGWTEWLGRMATYLEK